MATIKSLMNKFETLDTDKVIEDAFNESAEEFQEENREQMLSGLNRDGSGIGKYKSNSYAKKKFALNPAAGYGNVDLRLSGDMQMSIKVVATPTTVITESTDFKSKYQVDRYGDKIYGLGGRFKSKFLNSVLSPAIKRKITQITGLSFN